MPAEIAHLEKHAPLARHIADLNRSITQKTRELQALTKDNRSDRDLTQQIRQAIVKDKTLSSYAHNVKVISQNGIVTLKGPVHSDAEKQSIGDKAAEAAGGADKVTNQLTVKQ